MSNEITVKVIASKEELIKHLEQKGFLYTRTFSLDDYYFIPKTLDIEKLTTREIISKSLIIRNILDNNKYKKFITYKVKEIDEKGNILNQHAVNVEIFNIEQAKKLLEAIGYYQIMNIKEDDVVYAKDGLELAIKDVKNGDLLIEIETESNTKFDTIEKLKQIVKDLSLPIEPSEFFIKKAEIELEKTLKR